MTDVTRVFESGLTTRYHTENPVLRQCVAPHAWGVATLVAVCNPTASAALLKACLLHDAAERRGPGDIRFQSKRDNPKLREEAEYAESIEFERLGLDDISLSTEEQMWLKWADMAEVGMYVRNLHQDCGYPCAVQVLKDAAPVLKERVKGLNQSAWSLTLELLKYYEEHSNE